VTLVHAADALARELDETPEGEPSLDEAYLEAAGLSGELAGWRELARETLEAGEDS
jgi:hypothetical protein